MPTIPYAAAMVSVDGDTAVTGSRTVAGGNVIQLSGQSTAQWTAQRWELYDFPAGFATPTGWTLGPDGVISSTAVTPDPITVDRPRDRFGKYAFRLTVNDGLKNGVSNPEMVDESLMVLVPSYGGVESVSEMETNQFGTSWAEALKRDIAKVDASINHARSSVLTTNATPTILKTLPIPGPTPNGARLYVLRATVVAVGDGDANQNAIYDVVFSYSRSVAGTYTARAAVTTTLQETTAGFNVTVSQTGTDMNVLVTGAAATNLRWHFLAERLWTFAY